MDEKVILLCEPTDADREQVRAALREVARAYRSWARVARRLGISRQALREFAEKGSLPSVHAAAIHKMDTGVTYWDLQPHIARCVLGGE